MTYLKKSTNDGASSKRKGHLGKSNSYREQHDKILTALEAVEAGVLNRSAGSVSQALGRLAGMVKIHLAMEDKALYPQLIESTDLKVSAMAKSFQSEMQGIVETFDACVDKWRNSEAIERSWDRFAAEFRQIKQVLGRRIERENKELYEAFDRSG